MTTEKTIADPWGRGDVCGLIVSASEKMSKPLDGLTVEDPAPVDHFHARGFPADTAGILAQDFPAATMNGTACLDIRT